MSKMSKKEMKREKYLKKVNRLEIDEDGEECPRCGQVSTARIHARITEKLLSQPYYYSKWFCCKNRRCRTDIFYNEIYRVYPDNEDKGTIEDNNASISSVNLTKSGTPPWMTDEEYAAELRLKAIKEQLKPR